jgi:hypothetical protein
MFFTIILAFSAFFVAVCAAFFSIKGIMVLFAGSPLAVAVMASSLEIGKLVAASFLHTYWKKSSFLLKTYLVTAVFVLMGITSLGIFGYLSGAYQTHMVAVSTFDQKIAMLEAEANALSKSGNEYTERIKLLTNLRTDQEQRIKDAGNLKAPREQAYKAISEANEEIKNKEASLSKDRERLIEIEKEVSGLKITMNTSTDIGSFKFIAKAIGTDVDTAVRYFIFALMFVFDPLAVTLVLALNKLLEEREEKKKLEEKEYLQSLKEVANSNPVESDGIIEEVVKKKTL